MHRRPGAGIPLPRAAWAAAGALLLWLLGTAGDRPGAEPRLRPGPAWAWSPWLGPPGWGATVVTLNLAHGAWAGVGGLEAVARALERAGADLVGLQEVDRGLRRSGGLDQAAWLARRLGLDGAFAPALRRDGGEYGNALLSRWPVLGIEAVPLPGEGEPRAALVARVGLPPGPVRVVVTHLGLSAAAREAQAAALAAWLAREPDAPTVLLGDLNAEPEAPELRPLAAALRPLASPPTFPAWDPRHRSDAILVSGHWRADAVWVDPQPVSDHLALLARLVPRAGPGFEAGR